MNDVEKRELFEQQRKIFEAGVQRADKRTGSFSFLTWSFFIAPLIACEEFLAAMFKSAAAVEEDAKTAQVSAAPHAANDHPPASDPSKTSAEDETAKGPAASSDAHVAQLDPTGLLAQPHEDAPKPSIARSEAVAAATGGGGGGDDADSRYHDAHTSIDDSSVNSLSADSHLGSGQLPGGSMLEPVQSNVLGDSFGPSNIGSAHVLGTVGSLSNDVAGATAPVEAAVQPVLATVTDTVGTLPDDVAGPIAPVEAAVQPVLATVTDISQPTTSSQTAASDSAGAHTLDSSASALDVAQPAPATGSGATGDVAQPPGNVASDALADVGPVVDTTEPVLTTTAAALSNPTSDVSHPADTGNVATDAPNAAPVVDTSEPVLSLSKPATDVLQPGVPDTSTGQAPESADTLLALANATDAPIEVPGSATAAPANVATDVSNAAAAVDPTAIAGDVIALKDAPPPPENALFTGNQYTDYGVTLSSDIAVSPQHAASPADTASTQDTLVPVAGDAEQHAPPPPDVVDTTHPIDHYTIL